MHSCLLDKYNKILIPVTQNLIEISEGVTLASLDLNLLVDSWRLIIKLIGDYNGIISSEPSNVIEERTLRAFCHEISCALTQNDDTHKITMKLKLTIFYLHSIFMLCQHSRSIVENEWNKILVLYKTYLSSKYIVFESHPKIEDKISEYFSKIFQKIYRNDLLLQSLASNDELELLLETVLNIIDEPIEYSYKVLKQFGLFDALLKCLSDSNLVFKQNNIFKKTIEVLFVLRVSQKPDSLFSRTFDQKITAGVLQSKSVSLAIISIHVILQRLR